MTPVARVPRTARSTLASKTSLAPLRGRRRRKVAFVLGGGGNLGALQVGQLRALHERGVRADLVVGCSVGAMNGAAYAVRPSPLGIGVLEDLWLQLAEDPARTMPGTWMPSTVSLFRRGASIYPSSGLRASIEQFLGDARRFDDLAVPFECVATDVDANAETWFSAGDLVEPILASAALPSVYPMVSIDGRRYLDGGVVNNVPISRAIEARATRIYVLHVGPHGTPDRPVHRPIDVALIAYWIARNARFAADLANVPKGVEVIVLPARRRPDLRFDDFGASAELIIEGHRTATEYLDELERDVEGPAGRSARRRDDRDDREVDRGVDGDGEAEGEDAADPWGERLATELRRVVEELRGFASRNATHETVTKPGGPDR
ncbi:MAG: patatin-like phospholipase family protein [Microthrixaceae bacterium]